MAVFRWGPHKDGGSGCDECNGYSEEGTGRGRSPHTPLLTVPNYSPPINGQCIYQLRIIRCITVIAFGLYGLMIRTSVLSVLIATSLCLSGSVLQVSMNLHADSTYANAALNNAKLNT